MQIFLDTANLNEIKEAASWGILDGVTTNPSLVSREKKDFYSLVLDICVLVKGPVSAEVLSVKADEMIAEGRRLAAIHPNVVVKIPLIVEGLKAVKVLSEENIRTNVTLCFSANQALLSAKAGATYVSPFVGRLDDISSDGMSIIKDMRVIYDHYGFKTKILTASARHPLHVLEAARLGSDAITMPFKILELMVAHPLTEIGLKRFLADWDKQFGKSQ